MGGILVLAEHLRGNLSPQTGEVIGLARELKATVGGPLVVAVIADDPVRYHADLALDGVDEVLAVEAGAYFDPAVYEEAAHRLALAEKPRLVMLGHSVNGMGFGPALAVRLGGSFVSDAFGIESDGGRLLALRGGYGNKVVTKIDITDPCVTTLMLRGGSGKPPPSGSAPLRIVPLDLQPAAAHTAEHKGYVDPPPADVDITRAEFILSVGRGIQDEKNIERFRALAERLGAAFGCSRPIADSGWLPKAHQVGLSGKVAQNCKLYVALGISGAVQHLHGMKHVETIIAINTDRNAPIYTVATYGAAIDVFEFADALEREFN
ncbi:electron transfer flavoprotein subunit alpha/FixB family protein [Shinella sp. PSBB067]|uniref:electron transfer flavoprotein subunit alpha/FixB family protein n=1 Tax=Shinella sp. PSBB067 TaxID=2715959 RepID=UPI00193B4423|nr:electron transfer flavoprotein subunit alpha/FixB family protein [Shinella sp. PSBB067]QRI62340.1 electron transfer flavoprotein subunit alpha/FixB family protein [Shinella sp. PSBB067]